MKPKGRTFGERLGFLLGTGLLLLAACGGRPDDISAELPGGTDSPTHRVGGTVTGLSGRLTLQNNAGDDLTVSAEGAFEFATELDEGAAYAVTVKTQPLWQNCSVSRGSGTVSASARDVAIACATALGRVTTFAGSGSAGSRDDRGTAATLNAPRSVVVAADGSLFVTETGSDVVRKITPAGDVTRLAGGAGPGSRDGQGPAASFVDPFGLALGPSGDLFVSEINGHLIRRITPAADVTRFAGNGASNTVDGSGTAASFDGPGGLAMNADGDLFVAEFLGNVVRKITPAGEVSVFAGGGALGDADGIGTAAFFRSPYGIAVDKTGHLYVADTGNRRIRKITPAGEVSTLAGTGAAGADDGPGRSASFRFPTAVTVDGDGNVYVIDAEDNILRMVTPAGVVSTLAGRAGVVGPPRDGVGSAAIFLKPNGLAIAADGSIYVADTVGHLIRKVTPVR